ncbi:beta-galactosidase [Cellulomonas sp. zg-ZUI199]|uniref:Beta-galactosidase n=1 Tax=Cellulomonas wangleii TaxID=2816956 RepID=A0ABX8D6V9_9CELL|nr:beta-galactosidase [Cellulomonas wangleii]MBO0926702.1 beta-galactosidase [Cellulomonas wangleii]QVI63179.1 beta-galactosidase [Cellulomonas wangleii]
MTTTLQDGTVRLGPGGLVLDGREQVLACASLFYFRIPREEWAARLAAVRATGYTLVDVYVPWNFHELAPGEWDFTGRRDVGEFLDLAHAAGLGVLARPGPYICSEWDGGALPAWLPLEDGLALRQAEPRYLAHVERWFDRVLPLLVQRQHGRGGPVVAVQLENELDFFDTADRAAYVGALRDMAVRHGVEVPLVACAGQGDLVGATGGVPGVTPAFNFYPDDRSPFVEPEVRRYADLLAARDEPLLVTETNRAHVTLRRLLVSGAKVLAPYLQASGYDFGFTPSVGNWGDPGGFMTHDYDFGGYLSPTGEPRPQTVEARVLTAVTRTLGPRLARGVPGAADGAYTGTAPTAASPSRVVLDGGGTLLGVPNLGDEDATFELAATDALPAVPLTVPGHACALVLRDLPLEGFGGHGTLVLATGDLVGAGPDGVELAAAVPGTVALAAPGGAPTLVDLPAPRPGSPVRVVVDAPPSDDGVPPGEHLRWQVVVHHPVDVPGPDGPVTAPAGTPAAEPVRLTAARRPALPTRDGTTREHRTAPASEEVGVHRGRTHYAADVTGADELLLEGAGDLVDLAVDGRPLPTIAGFGATVVVPVAGASTLTATAETWGHPNFDDARLPGLAMGSLRGLGRVWSVTGRSDVHALWTVEPGAQWAGTPAPLRPLGGWSSTRVGAPVTYRRGLDVDGTHHHALHLPGLGAPVTVTVDGADHLVTPHDPWLHLAPGAGRDVAVTVPHVPGVLGGATLLRLAPVEGWQVEPQPDRDLVALAGRTAPAEPVDLPLRPAPGEELWLDVDVPPGGCSLRFAGTHVRVAAYAHGELLGRVWLGDPASPRFTGGDPGRLWLPGAWNSGIIRLMVRGTVGAEAPELGAVLVQPTGGTAWP